MINYRTHASEALGAPDLIKLTGGLHALRFETMKIPSARGALLHLLNTGTIAPGSTVIDSSSGIYAHALALCCHQFGLHCHIVGSTTIDPTLAAQLRILGATLETMPASTSLQMDQHRRVARIKELLAEHPDWHWMQQYHSPEHYNGYRTLGTHLADILNAQGYRTVHLVAPVGSGASSGGLFHGLRDSMATVLTGVQPFGSITFGSEHVADPDMLIAGIGSTIEFRNVIPQLYQRVHWLSFEVSRAASVELLRHHALFAGLSTGAAYAAARHEYSSDPEVATVFIAPDTGHRYTEAVFQNSEQVQPLSNYQPVAVGTPVLPWSHS